MRPPWRRGLSTETADAFLRLLQIEPRFDADDAPEGVAAAVCREALATFGSESALLVSLIDDEHVGVEWRWPTSSLLPPGKTLLLDEAPDLREALRDARLLRGPTPEGHLSGPRLRVPVEIPGRPPRLLVLEWPQAVPEPDPAVLASFRRFADQAALALEQAERRRAEEDSGRNAAQTRRLLAVSAALSAARTVREVARALRDEGRRQVGADAVSVYAVEGERIVTLVSDEAATTDGEQQGSFALTESHPIADAVRLDQLVLIESAALRDERYPLLRPPAGEPGYRASASVPLKAGAVAVGGIELLFGEERRFGPSDREFLAALADQGGLALERARLQAAEHSIAVRLQHQLLPLRLPDLAGIRNAGEYRAGTALMEVGGDWYDVVALSQTRVALTLGDVVGKGVTAAGVMGRLRSALRALALSCSDPTEVVAQLERFAETIDGAELATLICADLDLASGTLRYLHAGHLPTLLLDGEGGSRFLEDGRRTPLGVPPASPAPHSQVTLEPGTTVLLYSDGLVERRGEPLTDGLRRLEQQAGALAHLPPDELARTLVESMTADNPPSDDIVVLAVCFDGSPEREVGEHDLHNVSHLWQDHRAPRERAN